MILWSIILKSLVNRERYLEYDITNIDTKEFTYLFSISEKYPVGFVWLADTWLLDGYQESNPLR